MHAIFVASSAFHPALQKGSCADSWEGVAEVGEMALFPGPGLAFAGTPPDSSQRTRGVLRHRSSLKKSLSKIQFHFPFSLPRVAPFGIKSPPALALLPFLASLGTLCPPELDLQTLCRELLSPVPAVLAQVAPASPARPLRVLLIPSWAEPFLSPLLDTCIHTHPNLKHLLTLPSCPV